MSVPPPLPDHSHIETRLLVVAEMLEKAVAEVRRAMDDIKHGTTPPPTGPDQTDSGSSDVN